MTEPEVEDGDAPPIGAASPSRFAWRLALIGVVALVVRWFLVLAARPSCATEGEGGCFQVAGLEHHVRFVIAMSRVDRTNHGELVQHGRLFRQVLADLQAGRAGRDRRSPLQPSESVVKASRSLAATWRRLNAALSTSS